jgi:hypothetical protein
LENLGIPRQVLPQRGTVTATALDFALRCTNDGVFLAGMDLSNRDIKTHARPNALDRFKEDKAGRLDPWYSQAFVRAGQISASGSHRVYAEWFGGQLAAYPRRIRSLGKNNPVFDALPLQTPTRLGASQCVKSRIIPQVLRMPPASIDAVRVLACLLEKDGPAETIREELAPLLLPGDREVSAARLLKEIEALAAEEKI